MLSSAIRDFLAAQGLSPRRIALAVSGGGDSTALLLAFAEAGWASRVVAVHVNHRLRDRESDEDEDFVRDLSSRIGVEFVCFDGSPDPDRRRAVGVEAAARERRYKLLLDAAETYDCEFIATAHHRRDQAETVLLRLVTGSGLLRLRGIEPVSERRIIRPFLDIAAEELAQFVKDRGITPRHDATNRDLSLLRNRIRHELLPLLGTYNPRIEETLAETARQSRELECDLESLARATFEKALHRTEDETTIDTAAFEGLPWLLRHATMKEIRRLDPEARDVSAADVRRIVGEEASRSSVTPRLDVYRDGVQFRLKAKRPRTGSFEYELPVGERVTVEALSTAFRIAPATAGLPLVSQSHQLVELPNGSRTPFVIRNRRPGDRFHPLGAPGEKKLSQFLIDRKISESERDAIPLLLHGDTIAAVIGIEVSEQYKVSRRGETYCLTYERI